MSFFINVQRLRRPDFPQSVYKGVLALWEAPLYVPIGDEARNSTRPPWRALAWPSGGPLDVSWIAATTTTTPPTTAQLWPAFQPLGYRTAAAPALDVRGVATPDDGWVFPIVDAIVRTWTPVFQAKYQAPPARNLWRYPPTPDQGWITVNVPVVIGPTVAQTWPSLLVQSYRMVDRRDRLNVSTVPVSESSWWLGPFTPTTTRVSIQPFPNMSRTRRVASRLRDFQLALTRAVDRGEF